MVKRCVFNGCNKGCSPGVTHKCQETCNDCLSIPPCIFTDIRIPCESCNRTFRNQSCFGKHLTNKLKGKTVCAQKRNCANCSILLDSGITKNKHVYFKPYYENCQQYREIGHLCYMKSLSNELSRSDKVLFLL